MTPEQYEEHLTNRHAVALRFYRKELDWTDRVGIAASLGIAERTMRLDVVRASQCQTYAVWRPKRRGPKKGQHRTPPETLVLLGKVTRAAKDSKKNLARSARAVRDEVELASLPAESRQSPSTYARRMKEIEDADPVYFETKRHGKHGAKQFAIQRGSAHADFPLQEIQIDHTRLNHRSLILDGERYSIRPTHTAAVDLCTGLCLASFLSPLPPSELTVALCISMIGAPKTGLLRLFGVPGTWNEHGIASTIHVDGGGEFNAKGVNDGYDTYGTLLLVDAPGHPERKGMIERWFKTMQAEVNTWNGATLSNPQELDKHGGQKPAVMDFFEVQRQMLIAVMKYNNETYGSDEPPPVYRWKEAASRPEFLLRLPQDHTKYVIDHLPTETRDLRYGGLEFMHGRYTHEEFGRWLYRRVKKLVVKYDPRDITTVWARPQVGPSDPADPWVAIPRVDPIGAPCALWDIQEWQRRKKKRAESLRDNQLLAELHAAAAGKLFDSMGVSAHDFLARMSEDVAIRMAEQRQAARPASRPPIQIIEPPIAAPLDDSPLAAANDDPPRFEIPDFEPKVQ